MKIAILDFCMPHEGLASHGSIGSLIVNWLKPHLAEVELVVIPIAAGDPLPEINQYDGYLLSGSEKGVYDEAEWMAPTREFLLQLRDARIPLFGICFGHQLMADTYGGKAEKAEQGFVIGPRQINMAEQTIDAHVMHQDQVSKVPPGAKVTASAPYCPVAALQYDFPAQSIQFHPEYPVQFMLDAIDVLEGELFTAQQAQQARISMETQVPDTLFGAEVAAFFRNAKTE